jgi:hypothetical protein
MILAFLACGYPPEDFMADVDAASCQWQADCYDYESFEACMDGAEASRGDPPDCAYDADAARECVWEYEARECPEGGEGDAGVPAACLEVWGC